MQRRFQVYFVAIQLLLYACCHLLFHGLNCNIILGLVNLNGKRTLGFGIPLYSSSFADISVCIFIFLERFSLPSPSVSSATTIAGFYQLNTTQNITVPVSPAPGRLLQERSCVALTERRSFQSSPLFSHPSRDSSFALQRVSNSSPSRQR